MSLAVHGVCDDGFAAVADAFEQGFRDRRELGAAVAVWVDGRLVVDLWGGLADAERGRPWERDTIAHVYSATKPLAAACAWLLADRGALDLDAPVASIWPGYARAGKERTLVRHLLTHEAGLLLLRERQPADALLDWARMTELIAAEPPLWEPGTRHGEQALLFGHLVGEVVRRVDGRPLGRFLADELAAPWALDFHVGLDAAAIDRAARLHDPGGAWRRSLLDDPRPLLLPALDNPPGALDPAVVNSAAYRAAEVPAVNGHGTARALARFYGGVAAGGVLDGVRLLDESTVERALRPHAVGHDELLDDDASWGLGLQTYPDEGLFGLGGIGGYAGYGVRTAGAVVGFGYVTSRLGSHERADACSDALDAALVGLAGGAGQPRRS
jgi:CubicO group peptidase (beta-lactamase class C family)